MLSASSLHFTRNDFGKIIDRSWLILCSVGNTQTATNINLINFIAVGFLDASSKFNNYFDCFAKRMERKDLRPNMHVQPRKMNVWCFECIFNALKSEIFAHSKTKLRILTACANIFVSISLNAGSNAHVYFLSHAQFLGNSRNTRKLNARINHNATNPCFNSFLKFLRGFIITMHKHFFHRKTNSTSYRKFATTGNV